MTAYLIVDTDIHDPEAYERYKAAARPIAERFGGRYLARGGALTVVEDGLWRPTRMVIIAFPDRAAAESFVAAPDYQPVKAIRQGAAAATIAILDGL